MLSRAPAESCFIPPAASVADRRLCPAYSFADYSLRQAGSLQVLPLGLWVSGTRYSSTSASRETASDSLERLADRRWIDRAQLDALPTALNHGLSAYLHPQDPLVFEAAHNFLHSPASLVHVSIAFARKTAGGFDDFSCSTVCARIFT